MDSQQASSNMNDNAAKKVPLEELTKEDLIKKCKSLVLIAQKAKQAKDTLVEENTELKHKLSTSEESLKASSEIVDNVTRQKLDLVNTIQGLQMQNGIIEEKMKNMHLKMSELDTENISFKRQVGRLTDENEQLLLHLESLEKKIQQLTEEGLQQQEQLLLLEQKNKQLSQENDNNANVTELQAMLSRSLEEVKNLQKHVSEMEADCKLKDDHLENVNVNTQELIEKLEMFQKENEERLLEIYKLQNDLTARDESIRKQNETIDEINAEMHKSRALNERLQEDIKSTKERLSDNQIFTSGVTSDLENANGKLREKLKTYHSKIIKLASDIKILKQNRYDLLDSFKLYTKQVMLWKNDLNTLAIKLNDQMLTHHDEKKNLTDEINRLIMLRNEQEVEIDKKQNEIKNKADQLEGLLEQLRKDYQELKINNQQLNINYDKLTDDHHNLKENHDKLKNDHDKLKEVNEKDLELTEKSGQEIIKLVDENKSLNHLNETLKEKLEILEMRKHKAKDACHQTVEEYPTPDNDVIEQFTALKREHHEVLNEMNEMNQALKERGETISQQQAYCDELLKKIQIFEGQLSKKCDTLLEKEDIINQLERQLNDNTLTMIKPDENANNETIAILQKEIEQLREKLENINESSYAESETMSTSTISKTEEANRLKDLEGSWEERYGKLRNLALKLKAKIKCLSSDLDKEHKEKNELQQKLANNIKIVQSLQTHNDQLIDEIESVKNESKTYMKKLDQVAIDISKDKKQLAENEEEISSLKIEIENNVKEKSNLDNWKKQVSLKVQTLKKEVEAHALIRKDFENEIAKLKNDLEQSEKTLRDERDKHTETKTNLLESNNECKKQSVLNLEMQDYERSIKDLSQKLDMKQELINKLKNQLDGQKSNLNNLKEQNKMLDERSQVDAADLETNKQELKAYKTKINELESLLMDKDTKIAEVMHLQESVRIENEDLSSQLSSIIADNQKLINNIKGEKESLRIVNIGLEQKLRELQNDSNLKNDELCKLKEEHQAYKVRAQSVLRQNQTRDVGLEENLKEEIDTLKARINVLTSNIDDLKNELATSKKDNEDSIAEKQALTKENNDLKHEIDELNDKYNQLHNKHQQTIVDNAETIRGLKVHADTLSQCYRQQISDQEIRHNREIIELQSKLEKGNTPPEIPTLTLPPSMHREEGEGSESVDSSSYNQGIQPVPLEKLLSIDNDQEITIIKKQLLENESKVIHLTALLADTEQDLVKHVQMNKLLKEEIRRQQRSVEREQHAENLEYLKNVVYKFVTLSSGDERLRLVPVLNTILKLSPEETNKLNNVAKGDKNWSNYLPMWSNKTTQ